MKYKRLRVLVLITSMLLMAHNSATLTMEHLAISPEQQQKLNEALLAAQTVEGIESLLEQGADVNYADNDDGHTALIEAARNGHTGLVRLLIEHGADVNHTTSFGTTALIYAAEKGYKEIIELLLAQRAEVNLANEAGATALTWAAQRGHKEIAELLIAHGADVNCKTERGNTPLKLALFKSRRKLGTLLIGYGASITPTLENDYSFLKPIEQEINNSLVYARAMGDIRGVERLPANPEPTASSYLASASTALHMAAAQDHSDVIRLLLSNKFFNSNAQDEKGNTPLHCAIRSGSDKAARILLAHDAQVSIFNNNGDTSLHIAAQRKRSQLAHLLIHHRSAHQHNRADGWARNGQGNTPPHLAVCGEDEMLIRELMTLGVPLNIHNNQGYSPWGMLVNHNQQDIAEFIAKNARQNIPLEYIT